MPYNITLSNGTNLVTIDDGTRDETTSLVLIGKNFAGYGQFLNENFVQLLENFSNSSTPANPLVGQLWWDSTNKILKIYSGSAWKGVSGSTSSATPPVVGLATGDLWWDSANGQLKVYNGTGWTVIGPAYTATQQQSGIFVNQVSDDITTHIIDEFWVRGKIVAVLSKDSYFTPINYDSGFAAINPGFNLSTAITGLEYWGNADNALKLGGVAAANYIQTTGGTMSGYLSIVNDSGIVIGNSSVFSVDATTGPAAINLLSTTSGSNLNISANVSGVQTTLLTLDGTTGAITVHTPATFDNSGNIATTAFVQNTLLAGTSLQRNGSNTITGNIVPDSNSLYNFGKVGAAFNNIYSSTFTGTATNSTNLNGVSTYARTDVATALNGNVSITIPTPSTTDTTGALKVTGGVGIVGNLNVGGSITAGGVSVLTTASGGVGVNQIWYNMPLGAAPSQRQFDTIYQNTSTQAIMISLWGGTGSGGGEIYIIVGATSPPTMKVADGGNYNGVAGVTSIIPPSWYYKAIYTGGSTGLTAWTELK